MDTSLNMQPINRPAVMHAINESKTGQMDAIDRDGEQAGFRPVGRAGRKYTLAEQKQRLRDSARDFEAIFARQMMKHMRSGLMGEGMFGSGVAGEIYSDMMDTAVADKIAERGSLGLADMLYGQLVKRVEPSMVSGEK